jgi:zinc protease
MSKKQSVKQPSFTGYTFIKSVAGVEEYQLKSNGLRVLYHNRADTGVVTTNITYLVGARDEERGETGLAHMLEHMLFKPTSFDIKNKITAGAAVQFERETGCALNANTWKDRTTYYFSYPVEHMERALQIEAERMTGVVLTNKELNPERNNVLSEFDMYNGDPHFALSVQMSSAAFQSHPYGHETIGYREDIEDYNSEKLERFYRNYYRPDNAVMMVIGDVDIKKALSEVRSVFEKISNPVTSIPRFSIREPKQESIRRVYIERPSTTNILSIGYLHEGFPSEKWVVASIMAEVLASGPESILHKLLIDTGKASGVDGATEPSSERNLGTINVSLAQAVDHLETEHLVLAAIKALDAKTIDSLVKKIKARMLTSELFSRQSSMGIAAELTEYVSSGSWESYGKTADLLQAVTTKKVLECIKESFTENNMTIGHFIGKE